MKNISLILIFIFIIVFLDYKISSFDINYYYGKDNGAFVRAYSIIISSILYFVISSHKKRFLFSIIGFFVGIISVIISYIIAGKIDLYLNISHGLLYHILGFLFFISFFYYIKDKI